MFGSNCVAGQRYEKWYLPNGKCVEDELFAFGMQCAEEYPCHSFIVDPTDTNYRQYKAFTDDELQEISIFRKKRLPVMPEKLRDYLNLYNLSTTAGLRQRIFAPVEIDQEHAQDMD
ncbi:hypothetical protein MBANPS3_001751 [Mucor bainieri]